MTPLLSNGVPVALGGDVTIRTPGLVGQATHVAPRRADFRSGAPLDLGEFERGLEDLEVATQHQVEIAVTQVVPVPATGLRSAGGEPLIELAVPALSEKYAQALLSIDEAGVATWHFPQPTARGAVVRGRGQDVFRVPRPERPAQDDVSAKGATRGVLGWIGKKILKVVALEVLREAGGRVGAEMVRRWEASKRAYRLRTFTVEDFATEGTHIEPSFFDGHARSRHLLMVHGTFSRTGPAFGGMGQGWVAELRAQYRDRVLAFDHPTLTEDPIQNVAWLREHLPPGLPLDILCHSRGGLVARGIAGGIPHVEAPWEVGRVVFFGTPNAGTPLADHAYLSRLIDVLTNVLSLAPSAAALDLLGCVIEIVKEIAAGTATRLPGLESMIPGGELLKAMNDAPEYREPTWHAVTSNYEPQLPKAWAQWVGDKVFEAILKETNDLVVPTQGCFEGTGARFPRSPAERRHEHAKTVHHLGYFEQDDEVRAKVHEWLR